MNFGMMTAKYVDSFLRILYFIFLVIKFPIALCACLVTWVFELIEVEEGTVVGVDLVDRELGRSTSVSPDEVASEKDHEAALGVYDDGMPNPSDRGAFSPLYSLSKL